MTSTQAAHSETKTSSFGKKLQSARENQGITRKEAGQRIRLSEKIIIMLEKDFYSDDIPTAFIRGYLAIYAKFLELPDADVKTQLANILPKPIVNHGQPLALHNNPVARHSHLFVQLFSILIICTLIGLVGTWWYSQQKQAAFAPNKEQVAQTFTNMQPLASAQQPNVQPQAALPTAAPTTEPTIIVQSNDHPFTPTGMDVTTAPSPTVSEVASNESQNATTQQPISTAENSTTSKSPSKPIAQNTKKPRYVSIDPYTYSPQ